VINVNIMSDHPKVLGRIRSDDYEMGRLQGEFIVKALNGAGNVVMMSGVSGNSAFIARAKGFRDYVEKHPGIKIVSEQWTPNATDRGLKLMEDWSQTFPRSTRSTAALIAWRSEAPRRCWRRGRSPAKWWSQPSTTMTTPSASCVRAGSRRRWRRPRC
jgi:hypothetical protein